MRVLDTRNGIGAAAGPIAAGGTRTVDLRAAGVPADATMAVVNLTAVDPTSDGYVTAGPSGGAVPDTSNLNFVAGQTVADAAFVALGRGARLDVRNAFGDVHVLVDVTGYVAAGGARFVPASPARIKDTRTGLGGTGAAGAGTNQRLQVSGRGGVPGDATAVVLNVTAVDPTSATYLTVWPAGTARPEVSNLNTAAGETRPNLVVVRLPASGAAAGAIDLANAFGDVHVLVDVLGWFTIAPPAAASEAVAPHRVLDTRTNGDPLPPGGTRTVSTGMPGATAVVVNLTAVDATEAGYLTAWAADASRPDTSNVNVHPGAATPNLVVVHPAADGTVRIFNSAGRTHVLVDVVGRLG